MRCNRRLLGSLLGLALVVLVCAAALANPVAYDPSEVEHAVRSVAAGATGRPDSVFIDALDRDLVRFTSEATWQLLDAEFDQFAPLFIEAELPPDALSEETRSWFMDRADDEQRTEMLEATRVWLTTPRVTDEQWDTLDERARDIRHLKAMQSRIDAAEWLVDSSDDTALEPIIALRDSLAASFGGLDQMPVLWVEHWWYLYQAALRLETPDMAVLCRPSPDSGLEFVADPQDITVARYTKFFTTGHPEIPVDHDVARHVVALIEQAAVTGDCRERRRAPCSNHGQGLMVSVAGGREMTVSYNRDDTIVCSDNTRYNRWAYMLKEPELLALLKDMDGVFVAEKGRYPVD